MTITTAGSVAPGFRKPAMDAQQVFRLVLEAMSHPGRILSLPPGAVPEAPRLHPATAAVCLTLLDNDTPVWTDLPASSPPLTWLKFHSGCPFSADPGKAAFALVTDTRRQPSLDRFYPGTDEAPETAATLIMQVEALHPDQGCRLSGPGTKGRPKLEVAGVADDFWQQRQRICHAYPVGLDMIFVCGGLLAALPRSTIVNR